MKSKEYKQGNIQGFTAFIAERFNIDRLALAQALQQNFPAFQQKERCPNCDANMEVRLVTAGIHDALLLLKMGEAVRHEQRKGTEFSEANRVHTPSLPTTDAVRHTTTLASYLDLIWQPEKWRNSGYWLITDWGWKALRGEPVPEAGKVFPRKTDRAQHGSHDPIGNVSNPQARSRTCDCPGPGNQSRL